MKNIRNVFIVGLLAFTLPLFGQNKQKALAYYEDAMGLLESLDGPDKSIINEAINLYKKAIGADSKCVVAYEQLASEYCSLNNIPQAVKYVDEGIHNNPDSPTLYLIKGVLCEDQQQVKEAKDFYIKAQSLFKKKFKPGTMTFDEVLYYALTYYLLQNQDAAIDKFKQLADQGAFSDADYEWFYPLGIDTLTNMELTDFIDQSITNKYGLR